MQQKPATQVTVQIIAGALLAGPLFLLVIRFFLSEFPAVKILELPALALGIVAPIGAHAVYKVMCGRIRRHADPERRALAFQQATMVALAITEGAAFVGLMASNPRENPLPLIGLVGHILLTVAIWPGAARFQAWVHGPGH